MIINEILRKLNELDSGDLQETLTAHCILLAIHIKALAAHCECLGMNAENCIAASNDWSPPYGNLAYKEVMEKWELINKEGKLII